LIAASTFHEQQLGQGDESKTKNLKLKISQAKVLTCAQYNHLSANVKLIGLLQI
jgi:hypothetical protein